MLSGGLALVALASLGASLTSDKILLRGIIGFSSDDQVLRGMDTLSRSFHEIELRLRVCSAAFMIAALGIGAGWRKVQIWIEESILPLPRFLCDTAVLLVRGVKADGPLNICGLAAFFVIGLVERVRLLFRPFNFDEADTFIKFAARPLYIAVSWYPEPNNHLLHTVLMHYAFRLFGDQEWVLRLPALFAGCLLTPLTYWTARSLYNRYTALIASAMVTAASYLIFYSVDARGYSIQCAFFLLLTIVSQYLLDHDSPPAWLLWIIFATLGLYTIPTNLYAVATLASWMAINYYYSSPPAQLRQRLNGLAAALGVAGAMTALLYTPVLVGTGLHAAISNRYLESRTLSRVIAELPHSVAAVWRMWTAEVPAPLVWVFSGGLAVSMLRHRRIAGHRIPIPSAFVVSVPILVLAQRVVPIARIWIFLLPLIAVISAAGMADIIRRVSNDEHRRSGLSMAVALSVLLFMSSPDLRRTRLLKGGEHPLDGIPNTVGWIKSHLQANDVVLIGNGARAPFEYYLRRSRIPLVWRPAKCAPITVTVYASKAEFGGRSAGGERLLMLSRERGWEHNFATCHDSNSADPMLVGESGGVKIYVSSPIANSQLSMLGVGKRP
jgi:hypothetical protein